MDERYESLSDISSQAERSQKQSSERRIENRRNRRIAKKAIRATLLVGGGIGVYFGGGHILDRNLEQMEREGRPPAPVVTHLQSIERSPVFEEAADNTDRSNVSHEVPPLELPND